MDYSNMAGRTRSFTSFSQAIENVIDARVWTGIHFRTADKHGAKIACQVAEWRHEHYFAQSARRINVRVFGQEADSLAMDARPEGRSFR